LNLFMANHFRKFLNLNSWFHHNIKNLAYHLINQRSPLQPQTNDRPSSQNQRSPP
jgi:hypothetical protein